MTGETIDRTPSGVAWPGLLLIIIGVLVLAAQVGGPEWLGLGVLPALAIGFAIWGFSAGIPALLIPAGIIAGVGGSAIAGFLGAPAPIILGSIGAGFLSVPVLTRLAGSRQHSWGFIPGSIIIGVALVAGLESSAAWQWFSTLAAVAAIVAGFGILTWSARRRVTPKRPS